MTLDKANSLGRRFENVFIHGVIKIVCRSWNETVVKGRWYVLGPMTSLFCISVSMQKSATFTCSRGFDLLKPVALPVVLYVLTVSQHQLCHGYMWNKIISKFISQAHCSWWIFSNMFINRWNNIEIILVLL